MYDEILEGLPNQSKPQTPDIPYIERVEHLSDLNIEQELLDRYYDCRIQLQQMKDSPGKDVTQTMNSLMNIMKMIVSMKTELYNMERIKRCEEVLIEVLQEWPDVRDEFLNKYKERLDGL